jgi:hypothetical protein
MEAQLRMPHSLGIRSDNATALRGLTQQTGFFAERQNWPQPCSVIQRGHADAPAARPRFLSSALFGNNF